MYMYIVDRDNVYFLSQNEILNENNFHMLVFSYFGANII